MRCNTIAWVGLLACTSVGCSFIDDFDRFKKGDGSVIERPPHDDGGASDAAMDARTPDGDDSGTTTHDGGGKVDHDGSTVGHDGAVAHDAATHGDGGDGAVGRCGDGNPDPGEECDDGNAIPGDGCEPVTCTRTPPAICNGTSCDDGNDCTVDVCDLKLGCSNHAIDADGDGYSPGKCKGGSTIKGGDCNDAVAAINPKAAEVCDGLDNNCDGNVDEGLPKLHCYPDVDADGFPNLSVPEVAACACGAGMLSVTMPSDKTNNDCWDVADTFGPDVNPKQTKFFDRPYGTGAAKDRSYDYNCDGMETEQLTGMLASGGCPGLLNLALCAQTAGFVGAVPVCGDAADYTTCSGGSLLGSCSGTTEQRTQACN